VLVDYNVPIDVIVGAGCGSIVTAYYAYGYTIDEMPEHVHEELVYVVGKRFRDFEHVDRHLVVWNAMGSREFTEDFRTGI